MAKKVDYSIKDRDYLYGRVLACYDFLERVALAEGDSKGMLGTRPTNAWRLMPTFFAMPATVTKRLQMAINPYVAKCWKNERTARAMQTLTGILAELGAIGEAIDAEVDRIETPLGMNALLGYSAQLYSLGLFFATKDNDDGSEEKPDYEPASDSDANTDED